MVISEEYQYLFIEIPLTASWTIRNELRELYGGQSILHKHATYSEFKRHMGDRSLDLFVFGAVRNPLDAIVSRYLKLKGDHKGAFTNPDAVRSGTIEFADAQRHRVIREEHLTFAQFFRRFHRRPYGGLLDLSSDHMDFVMRYERIQRDFFHVLRKLGIAPIREVPVTNRTTIGKRADWTSYYPPEIIEQAKRVCGPYMSKWGYEFPESWGVYQPAMTANVNYILWRELRKLYTENIRYRDGKPASFIRWLRGRLAA